MSKKNKVVLAILIVFYGLYAHGKKQGHLEFERQMKKLLAEEVLLIRPTLSELALERRMYEAEERRARMESATRSGRDPALAELMEGMPEPQISEMLRSLTGENPKSVERE